MTTPEIPGYRTTGTAGRGVRGGALTVITDDGRNGVAVIVEPGLEMRIRALRDLRHANLPAILDVVRLESGSAAVILETVTGPSLATLVQARGHLEPAELATLWQSIAHALAAMHQRGLVHGDVSPGNIVLTQSGPVLLDIVGHDGAESGHRGHAAPEIVAGGPPSEAGDVWGLARAVAWASDDDAAVIQALGSALADRPFERPSARAFATWPYLLGTPIPIRLPDGATLAGAQVRAGVSETVLLPPRPKGGRRLAWLAWAGAAAVVGLVLTTILDDAGAHPGVPDPDGDAVGEDTAHVAGGDGEGRGATAGDLDEYSAREAVYDLLERRDTALSGLDTGALESVYVSDSVVGAADLAVVHAMNEEGVEVEGFGTEVLEVDVLGADDLTGSVEATIVQRAHSRTEAGETRDIPEGDPTCVHLDLAADAGVWRIAGIAPCTNGSGGGNM